MEIIEPRTETGQYLSRAIPSKYQNIEELIQPNATELCKGTISYDFGLELYSLRVINRAQKEACESKSNDLQRNAYLYDIICTRNCTDQFIVALEDSNNGHILDKLLAHLIPDYLSNSKPDQSPPVLISENAEKTTEADTSIDNEPSTGSRDTASAFINSSNNVGASIETRCSESEHFRPATATVLEVKDPILTNLSSSTHCQSDSPSVAVADIQTITVTEHNGPSASRNDEDERVFKNDDFNTTKPGESMTEEIRTSSSKDTLIEIEPTLPNSRTQSVNTDAAKNGASGSSNDGGVFNENDSNAPNPNKTDVVIGITESDPLLDTNQGSQEITNSACSRRTWLKKLCLALATLALAFTAVVCMVLLILLLKEGSPTRLIPPESNPSLVLTPRKEPSHVTEQPLNVNFDHEQKTGLGNNKAEFSTFILWKNNDECANQTSAQNFLAKIENIHTLNITSSPCLCEQSNLTPHKLGRSTFENVEEIYISTFSECDHLYKNLGDLVYFPNLKKLTFAHPFISVTNLNYLESFLWAHRRTLVNMQFIETVLCVTCELFPRSRKWAFPKLRVGVMSFKNSTSSSTSTVKTVRNLSGASPSVGQFWTNVPCEAIDIRFLLWKHLDMDESQLCLS